MFDWYEPGEDTYTFIDFLKGEDINGKIVVDLGTSIGALTEELRKHNTVVSMDLNIKALRNHIGGNLIRSDLMSCINQDVVDVVVFNPPYVPDSDDMLVGGGMLGRRVIDRFIETVFVNKLYLLVIEANRPNEVMKLLENRGYRVRIAKQKRILGERIYIIEGEIIKREQHYFCFPRTYSSKSDSLISSFCSS